LEIKCDRYKGISTISYIDEYCRLIFHKENGIERVIFLHKGRNKRQSRCGGPSKQYGTNAPTRYTCADIKKATGNSKHKLQEGGYGVVYKGELDNGYLAAVKLLKKSDGKEFINEIANIIGQAMLTSLLLLVFGLLLSRE